MIGSNTDSTKEINLLMETSANLGASNEQIEEALKNKDGSNSDSRKIIGLLKLITSLVAREGSDNSANPNSFKYEWDGDTTGKEVLSLDAEHGIVFYRVFSEILSEDELLGATVKFCFESDWFEGEISQDGDITIHQTDAGNYIVMYGNQLPIALSVYSKGDDSFGGATLNIPETGLWLLHASGEEEYTHYLQKN